MRINQLSDDFVEDVKDVVRLGQHVWVKVMEVRSHTALAYLDWSRTRNQSVTSMLCVGGQVQDNVDGSGKVQIALSMRFADQASGRDLDPGEEDWRVEQAGGNPRDRSKRIMNEQIALKVNEHGGAARYGTRPPAHLACDLSALCVTACVCTTGITTDRVTLGKWLPSQRKTKMPH